MSMYNFLKNIALKIVVMLMGLLICQLDAMSRAYQNPKKREFTPRQLAAKKKYFAQLNQSQVKKAVEKQALLLKPDEFLVYEENTGHLVVPRDIVMLSGTVRGMIENIPDARTIPIKYSINSFQEVVSLIELCSNKSDNIQNLMREKINGLPLKQLVDVINIFHELNFSTKNNTCDQLINSTIGDPLVLKTRDFIKECVAIGVYALCDIKKWYVPEAMRISCDSEESMDKLFDSFWDKYKSYYDALDYLNRTVEERVLNRIIRQFSVFLYPMNVVYGQWEDVYNRLETATSISEFLNTIKDVVAQEIKNRKVRDYQKEQSKLPFWQRDLSYWLPSR